MSVPIVAPEDVLPERADDARGSIALACPSVPVRVEENSAFVVFP